MHWYILRSTAQADTGRESKPSPARGDSYNYDTWENHKVSYHSMESETAEKQQQQKIITDLLITYISASLQVYYRANHLIFPIFYDLK